MRSHSALSELNPAGRGRTELFGQFKGVVTDLARKETASSKLSAKLTEERLAFIVGGVFATLERWRESGCEVPEHEVVASIDELVRVLLAPCRPSGS